MCLSKAYIENNGEKKLLAEEVASVEVKGNQILLKTLFGEKKEIVASIREINFVSNSIILENSGR